MKGVPAAPTRARLNVGAYSLLPLLPTSCYLPAIRDSKTQARWWVLIRAAGWSLVLSTTYPGSVLLRAAGWSLVLAAGRQCGGHRLRRANRHLPCLFEGRECVPRAVARARHRCGQGQE